MNINRFGWIGKEAESKAFDEYRESCVKTGQKPYMLEFSEAQQTVDERIAYIDSLTGGNPRPFTWDLARDLKAGGKMSKELKAWFQLIGDCVAVSTNRALNALSIIEVGLERQEENVWDSNPSWTYGTGRNFIAGSKIQKDRTGDDDGMLGSWAAQSVNEYGILFQEYPNVEAYSQATCKWGNYSGNWKNKNTSWYVQHKNVALPHTVTVVRCKTYEDGLKVLKAGGVLTIASDWGFKMKYEGDRHVYRKSGSWMHQMYFTDYEESSAFSGWYRMNQWGETDTLVPKNGETRGGAWQTADDIAKELKGNQQELFGYLCLQGAESKPDWGLI